MISSSYSTSLTLSLLIYKFRMLYTIVHATPGDSKDRLRWCMERTVAVLGPRNVNFWYHCFYSITMIIISSSNLFIYWEHALCKGSKVIIILLYFILKINLRDYSFPFYIWINGDYVAWPPSPRWDRELSLLLVGMWNGALMWETAYGGKSYTRNCWSWITGSHGITNHMILLVLNFWGSVTLFP